MPNWCQNVATIVHEDKEKIDAIENELNKEKDDVALFQMLRPRPADQEENWYSWNVENWGTKWDISYCDFDRIDDYTIKLNFDTAWGPCTTLYEHMETEGYTVAAYYNEDGMCFCGQFVDGYDDHYEYSDLDSAAIQYELPSEIDELFGISERMQEWEAENEDEDFEDDDEDEEPDEPEYEMTEWFNVKTKPVHIGEYEVQYKEANSWPFPTRLNWTGKKWMNGQGEERKDVGQWRGITEAEYLMTTGLEQLKEEFEKLSV
jgi:hypothetical protein